MAKDRSSRRIADPSLDAGNSRFLGVASHSASFRSERAIDHPARSASFNSTSHSNSNAHSLASSHPAPETTDDPRHSIYDDDDHDDDSHDGQSHAGAGLDHAGIAAFDNDGNEDERWDHLRFNAFVGREDELERLNSIYGRICRKPLTKPSRNDSSNKDAQVVLIHGYSGTGKSALVDRFLHRLNDGAIKSPSPSSPPSQTATSAIAHSVQDDASAPSKKRRADSHPCHYGKGKYDQFNAGSNLSAIVDALSHFFQNIFASGDTEECERIRTWINGRMDATRRRLACRAIPGLAELLRENEGNHADKGGSVTGIVTSCGVGGGNSSEFFSKDDASISAHSKGSRSAIGAGVLSNARSKANEWTQLVYSFKIMLKAICTDDRPLVLCLDDLQWIDERSLKLITEILIDPSIRNLLIIGSYRSNEVHNDPRHQLTTAVSQWKNNGKTIHDIPLNDLTVTQTSELLASSLRLDTMKTTPLAKLLHDKTKGNVLYTMQALEGLRRRKVLTRNIHTMQWEWDEQRAADEIDMAANVVDLITAKLHSLPEDLQKCLQMASFLRSTFRQSLLETLMDREIEEQQQQQQADDGGTRQTLSLTQMSVSDALNLAVKEELLERLNTSTPATPATTQHMTGSGATFRFVHDRIQQAAFSLTPPGDELNCLKYRVGKRLMEIASDPMLGEDWMWFVAADHLENVSSLSVSDSITPAVDLIIVNLKAGQLAVGVAAFVPAVKYLKRALSNLESKITNPWEMHYELCLEIHHSLSEAELTLGNYDKGAMLCQTIIDKCGNSVEDTIQVNSALATALGRSQKFSEALKLHHRSLQLLGTFPMRNHLFLALRDFSKLKRYFAKHTDEDVLNLPQLTNPNIQKTMAILPDFINFAYHLNRNGTLLLAVFRQARLMLKHGLSAGGAYAVCCSGTISMNVFKNVELSDRLCSLSKKLMQATPSKSVECQHALTLTAFKTAWSEPLHVCLNAYQGGQRAGMETGDLSHAYRCWGISLMHAFVTGMPLRHLLTSGKTYIAQTMHYKLVSLHDTYVIIQDMIENLMGTTNHSSGGGSKQQQHWKDTFQVPSRKEMDATETSQWCIYYWTRIMLSTYFGELELGKEYIKPFYAIASIDHTFNNESMKIFHSSLMMSRLAKSMKGNKSKRRNYCRQSQKYIDTLKTIIEQKGGNNVHRYMIMQADLMAASRKDPEHAVKAAYDKAISLSARSGHVHDTALANELAAEYFISKLPDAPVSESATASGRGRTSSFDRDSMLEDDSDSYWPRQYLANALSLYHEWGANVKVDSMLKKHSAYLDRSMLTVDAPDMADSAHSNGRRKRKGAKHTAATRMCLTTAHKVLAEVDFDAL